MTGPPPTRWLACSADRQRPPANPVAVRVGDRERADAADRLAAHAAAGRLTVAELEERLDRVHSAVLTRDLQVTEADLPGPAIRRADPHRRALVAIAVVVAGVLASGLVGHPVVPLFIVGALVWRARLRIPRSRPMLARGQS